jgi:hypothetical protein
MSELIASISQESLLAIDAKHDLLRAAFATGDAEIIGKEFYAPEAWVVGPDTATWKGTERIISLYGDFVGLNRWKAKRESIVANGSESISEYIVGTTISVETSQESDFKILFIWSKIGKEWLCGAQFYASGSTFD